MTLPRPVLIALLGLALCAAAFLATRSANDTGGAVTSTPAPATPAQKPATKPAKLAHAARKPGAHAAAPAKPAAAAKPENHAAAPATKPQAATKPAIPAKPSPQASDVKKTLPAIKALGRGDVVVFFFSRPGAADDTGSREAVKSLRGKKGVSVFNVGFDDIDTYRPVLSGAQVSQVPAIVIVKAGKSGRLLEGFVDAATLRQNVADARR
jgi:hypothetical protein